MKILLLLLSVVALALVSVYVAIQIFAGPPANSEVIAQADLEKKLQELRKEHAASRTQIKSLESERDALVSSIAAGGGAEGEPLSPIAQAAIQKRAEAHRARIRTMLQQGDMRAMYYSIKGLLSTGEPGFIELEDMLIEFTNDPKFVEEAVSEDIEWKHTEYSRLLSRIEHAPEAMRFYSYILKSRRISYETRKDLLEGIRSAGTDPTEMIGVLREVIDNEPEEELVRVAIRRLGELNKEEAMIALTEYADDADFAFHSEVEAAMDQADKRSHTFRTLNSVASSTVLPNKPLMQDEATREVVIQLATTAPDPAQRQAAMGLLRYAPAEVAVPALAEAMKDQPVEVRRSGLYILSLFPQSPEAAAVLKTFSENEPDEDTKTLAKEYYYQYVSRKVYLQ